MPELVLYGIRLLAKQFLGTVLDIEVDHSGVKLSPNWSVSMIFTLDDPFLKDVPLSSSSWMKPVDELKRILKYWKIFSKFPPEW